MPKKYFKDILPDYASVRQNRWIRPFGAWLQHHNLWHIHRRSVSGGVAVGMFCGLIPGPFQMLAAALLAVLFRVNLPIAVATTLYTNPFTIVPLYVLAYQLGAWVLGHGHVLAATHFEAPDLGWDNWFTPLLDWVVSLGKPFAVGLPLLAVLLAVLGYVTVRIGWRLHVVSQWRRRAARRRRQGSLIE